MSDNKVFYDLTIETTNDEDDGAEKWLMIDHSVERLSPWIPFVRFVLDVSSQLRFLLEFLDGRFGQSERYRRDSIRQTLLDVLDGPRILAPGPELTTRLLILKSCARSHKPHDVDFSVTSQADGYLPRYLTLGRLRELTRSPVRGCRSRAPWKANAYRSSVRSSPSIVVSPQHPPTSTSSPAAFRLSHDHHPFLLRVISYRLPLTTFCTDGTGPSSPIPDTTLVSQT